MINWWKDKVEDDQLDFFDKIVADIEDAKKFTEYLPIYSLAAAAGKFSEGQEVREGGWIRADIGRKLNDRMFVIKIIGRSMEPIIPSGSLCVFGADVVGSRQGKIVLAEHHDITDPDTHGRYTVKRYRSEKKEEPDGTWRHERITLEPINREYQPIVLTRNPEEEFRIIAEFIAVLK